jgi:hypothetical protein
MYLEAKRGPAPRQGISVKRLEYFVQIKEPQMRTQLMLLSRILDSLSDTLSALGSVVKLEDRDAPQSVPTRLALGSGRALLAIAEEARELRDQIQEGLESDARRVGEDDRSAPFEKLLERYAIYLRDPAVHSRICPSEELIEKFASWTP